MSLIKKKNNREKVKHLFGEKNPKTTNPQLATKEC